MSMHDLLIEVLDSGWDSSQNMGGSDSYEESVKKSLGIIRNADLDLQEYLNKEMEIDK